jgi:rhodanese-related sulfurtransferase
MKTVTASQLSADDVTLIDVREYPEFAAASIRGAKLVPLSTVAEQSFRWPKEAPLVIVCKSGRRASKAAEGLTAKGFSDVSILDGGMDAWQKRGLPVEVAQRRPWSLERQVRVGAGSLIVGFSALGLLFSPKFFSGAALVGAGLVFAGVSDTCMMGRVLAKMPWNRNA